MCSTHLVLNNLITLNIFGLSVFFIKIELIIFFLERVSLVKMQDAILRKPKYIRKKERCIGDIFWTADYIMTRNVSTVQTER